MKINDKYLNYSLLTSLKQKENYEITENDLQKIKQIQCQREMDDFDFLSNLTNLEELTINLQTYDRGDNDKIIDFSFLKSLKKN